MSEHRATKVVRLTVDNLEVVLKNVPWLKVIHLLRDPRAVINSRITTTWYSLKDAKDGSKVELSRDADDLCQRMTYDLKASADIKRKYPDRFSLVLFEDLQDNLDQKAYMLYNYLGIDTSNLEEKLGSMSAILGIEHTVNNTSGDFSGWWRHQLSFMSIDIVQSVCKDVFNRLGYRIFNTPDEVSDLSLKAFDFDRSLLLQNIENTKSYDMFIKNAG